MTKPWMRLAVVNQEEEGGATAAALEALRWGPERGIEVRYFPSEEFRAAGVAGTEKELTTFDPDVVHFHCWYQSFPYDWPLRIRKLVRRARQVYTFHDVAVVNQYGEECWECYRNPWCWGCPALEPARRWRPNYRMLERFRKRRTNRRLDGHAVYPSAWMQRRLARSELADMPGEVIPYSVDTELFKPGLANRERFGLGDGPLTVFAGNMYSARDQRKGLPDLLAVWPAVRDAVPEGLLAVAGRVEMSDPPPGVVFLGDLPAKDLAALLRSADLFCMPSRGDNLPVAVLESMASGLPVVATRVGGIPEEVEDGVSGLLVPERDGTALAGALRELLVDAPRRRSMGAAARARAVRLFSSRRSGILHEALYRRLIAS